MRKKGMEIDKYMLYTYKPFVSKMISKPTIAMSVCPMLFESQRSDVAFNRD